VLDGGTFQERAREEVSAARQGRLQFFGAGRAG